MLKYIKSFFLALNANTDAGDIAHAAALGLLLAWVPRTNLLWVLLFLITLFLRVNKGAFFLSLILLSFVVPLADLFIEAVGYSVLSLGFMEGIFTILYQTPFVGLTQFSNSLVAGSLIAGVVAYVPVYLLVRLFVVQYRIKYQPMVAGSKAAKIFVQLPLIKQIINAPDLKGFVK